MEVGRTSPYRPHLSSCSTNESSDGSSKSISLDLVENPVVSILQLFSPCCCKYTYIEIISFLDSTSESNDKYRTCLHNNEATNYITSILWMARILSSLIDRENSFIGSCAWTNNARHWC